MYLRCALIILLISVFDVESTEKKILYHVPDGYDSIDSMNITSPVTRRHDQAPVYNLYDEIEEESDDTIVVNATHGKYKKEKNLKYILVWPYVNKHYRMKEFSEGRLEFFSYNCPYNNCHITHDETDLELLSDYDAIIFHPKSYIIPSLRSFRQKYIVLFTEPGHLHKSKNTVFNGFYNWTMSYRLNSDVVIPYISIVNDSGVVGPKKHMDWHLRNDVTDDEKLSLTHILAKKTKLATFFESDDLKYIKALNESLKHYGHYVDVNENCRKAICQKTMPKNCNMSVLKRYYFYLAFENLFGEDYVTEKLLHALKYYAIPVVYGGADYSNFLPPGSYINACGYRPDELASLLVDIMKNRTRFAEFFTYTHSYRYKKHDGDAYCTLCEMMNTDKFTHFSTYYDFVSWFNEPMLQCTNDTKELYYSKTKLSRRSPVLDKVQRKPKKQSFFSRLKRLFF